MVGNLPPACLLLPQDRRGQQALEEGFPRFNCSAVSSKTLSVEDSWLWGFLPRKPRMGSLTCRVQTGFHLKQKWTSWFCFGIIHRERRKPSRSGDLVNFVHLFCAKCVTHEMEIEWLGSTSCILALHLHHQGFFEPTVLKDEINLLFPVFFCLCYYHP